MELEAKLTRVKELTQQREAIDAELRSLFAGDAPKEKRVNKCGKCGQEGHSARTCTQQPGDGQ